MKKNITFDARCKCETQSAQNTEILVLDNMILVLDCKVHALITTV